MQQTRPTRTGSAGGPSPHRLWTDDRFFGYTFRLPLITAETDLMLDLLTSPEAWASLLTLSVLEIVLGIAHVLFLSIISSRLPAHPKKKARRLGRLLARTSVV